MKTYRIQNWTTRADQPDQTEVTAAVITQLGPISKTDIYEFVVQGRFESITPEFDAAVRSVLEQGGLLA
jgi:hypothetical protein